MYYCMVPSSNKYKSAYRRLKIFSLSYHWSTALRKLAGHVDGGVQSAKYIRNY